MSVVLLILKIIAWILLGILALVFVALFIPVIVDAGYEKRRLRVTVHFFFLRFTVYDSGRKRAKKDRKQDAPQDDVPTEEKSKLDWDTLKQLLRPGAKMAWSIIKRLRIYDVHIVMVAAADDYATVGILAGGFWATIGGIMTALGQVWPNIGYEELTVIPDYLGERGDEEKYSCKIAALPVIIGIASMVFLYRYIKIAAQRKSAPEHNEKEMAS